MPNSTVHGALRCLALLSGDLDDKEVPTLVPVLFPCLHAVVSSPQVCILIFIRSDLWLITFLACQISLMEILVLKALMKLIPFVYVEL